MATLYIDTAARTKQEVLRCVESAEEATACGGMEQVVVQQADGISYVDVAHTVVRAASLNKTSKALKRLFFYFIETFPKMDADGNLVQEALVFCNFLRQQIEHPNEFVRGRAIGLVARLNSLEMVELLYKPLKDNLYHPNSYVRRNAYAALGAIGSQYRFEEVPQLLFECFANEIDPLSLKQLFATLHAVAPDLAMRHLRQCEVAELPPELLLHVLLHHRDEDFALHCVRMRDRAVRFQAAANLIECCLGSRAGREQGVGAIKNNVDVVMGIIADDEFSGLRQPALELFRDVYRQNLFGFKGYAIEILGLCSSSDGSLARAAFDFAFEISEPHEFMQISDVLLGLFRKTPVLSEQKKRQKTLFLEMMARLVQAYGIYEDHMLDEVQPHLLDNDPELQFGAFRFVHEISKIDGKKALGLVLKILRGVKFGKIFRYALNIVRESAKQGDVQLVVDELHSLTADPVLPYKVESSNTTHIAIVLTEMVLENREGLEKAVADKAVLVLLRLGQHDIDLCSKSTVNACIRRLIRGATADPEGSEAPIGGDDVLKPLVFSLVPVRRQAMALPRGGRGEKVDVVQLTSLSDPLYCEANVKVQNDSLHVDVLCINQTEFNLSSILFDFTVSSNLHAKAAVPAFAIPASATREVKFVFRIREAMNGFILGQVTFRYPDERKKFSASEMSINLGEIRLSVLGFLRPHCIDAEAFRRKWLSLEWENVYSLKFHVDGGLEAIAKAVVRRLSGFLVNDEAGDDFHLGNVSCVTEQGTEVLVNLCIRRAETVHFEARIRSGDEELVKSLSAAVGETLKGLRE